MVLADLGRRINAAMSGLSGSNVVDEKVLDHILKEVCTALIEADVNIKLVASLRKSVKSKVNFKDADVNNGSESAKMNRRRTLIQKAIFDELVSLVDANSSNNSLNEGTQKDNNSNNDGKKKNTNSKTNNDEQTDISNHKVGSFKPKKGKSSVIMMVGLQGAGKTTTCTKIAVWYQRRGFKTGLVCADTFRAGAFDQLKQNAARAKIPFYGSYTETDPTKVASIGVEKLKKDKFEVIIVDTSGRHEQEQDLFDEMVNISKAIKPNETIMVLDASIGQAAESQSRAFKSTADFGAIVITKMDGHAKGGGAISAVAATKTPIAFIGTGEHIYDLEPFSARPFIQKLLGMGDIQGLFEHMQSLKLDQKSTLKHIEQGIFTLRDLRDQMGNIMKMGSLSKLAEMIPGMSGMLNAAGGDEEGAFRMKRIMIVLDSMNDKELDSDGKIFIQQPTRITRVARGSGSSVSEVEYTLTQQRLMANMAKSMGGKNGMLSQMQGMNNPLAGGPGGPGGKVNMAQAAAAMARNNPQFAAMQRSMMQQGKMPDMSKLMQMMGGGSGGPGGPGGMPDMSSLSNMMQGMFGGGMR